MKVLTTIIAVTFISVSSIFAQNYPRPLLAPGESQIEGGLGISWINENGQTVPYYMIGVMPDLQFGKLGIGLNLTMRISTNTGKIRKADWSGGAYRKIIRYISWGQKHDPVFAKVGQMDMATLGHGFIVYDYNNSPSYDNRTIGAELDLDFNKFGFETMYGNFNQPGVIGGRFYVRPLRFTTLGEIPIIGGFELGATYVTDQNKNSGLVEVNHLVEPNPSLPPGPAQSPYSIENTGRLSEYGFDAGLPVLRIPFADADLYYDYAQINHFGHGSAAGILFNFNGLGLAKASIKLEHQWIGRQFIPEYFNQFYELNRYVPNDTGYFSQATQLANTPGGQGWYGQITVAVLQQFQIVGGYRGIDHDPNGGLLHLETRFPNLVPMIAFSAGYDRWGIQSFKDAFQLDKRSLLYAFFGYKPYPFMTVGFNYYWTFIPVSGGYQVQKRIEPRVMFNFSF